jgi:uncharacterized membrane protein
MGGYPPQPGYPGFPGGQPFSVTDAVGYGWKKFTENWLPYVLTVLLISVVMIFLLIPGVIALGVLLVAVQDSVGSSGFPNLVATLGLSAVFALVFSLLGFLAYAAIYRGALATTDGQQVTFATFFSASKLQPLVVVAVVFAVINAAVSVLPGFIGSFASYATTFFATYAILFALATELSGVEALKASWTFVIANIGPLILLFLLGMAINLGGALVCGVGLLVSIPLVALAQTYAFRMLQGQAVAP